MSEEEYKAIERLDLSLKDICFATLYSQEEADEDIKIVLDLVKRMDSDILKKDRKIEKLYRDNCKLSKEAQQYFDAYMDGVSDLYGKDMEIDRLVKMLYSYLKFMKCHNFDLDIDERYKTYNKKDEESMRHLKERNRKKIEEERNDGIYG